MKRLFSKLFAHVLVAGLKTWAGLIREEVAEEGLCLPVSPVVVGAENKEGQGRGDSDKWEAFPASFPSFSPPLEPVLEPRQKHASAYKPAFLSPWLKELPQSRLLDKPSGT